jgi:glucose-6-phosphate 1-dehydrogenase
VIFDNLSQAGLVAANGDEEWARVLVEKPFGNDLESARGLDAYLKDTFREGQIFRIDHYLAKDALQNILTFRFSNTLFQNAWNAECIERVHIRMREDFGVENRGAFYDGVGALRDVGENHMLQMLALTAMENPGVLETEPIRTARTDLLGSLKACTAEDVAQHTVRAQYDGYTKIDGVADTSQTETYFQIRAFIENERWRGVPFYLESGKALNETRTEISVVFKPSEPCRCGDVDLGGYQNVLTISIKPDYAIRARLYAKKPGLTYEVEEQVFTLAVEPDETLPDAYEKVLFDAIRGDQTLFASSSEVEASWRFITPILENWDAVPLQAYEQGSAGPDRNLEV